MKRCVVFFCFFSFFLSPILHAQDTDDPVTRLAALPVDAAFQAADSLAGAIFDLGDLRVTTGRLSGLRSSPAYLDFTKSVQTVFLDEPHAIPSGSLSEKLKNQPSVVWSDDLGQGLGARVDLRGFGGESKQALVLHDGIRAVEPFDNSVTWNLLPMEFFERMEINPGGASPVFGEGALSGAILLEGKKPSRRWRSSAETSVGSYHTYRIFSDASGTMPDGTGLWLGARYQETDGYRQNADHEGNAFGVTVTRQISDLLSLDSRVFYADNETGIAGPLTPSEAASNRRQKDPDGQFGDKFTDNLFQSALRLDYTPDKLHWEFVNLFGYRLRDQDSVQSFGGSFPGTSINKLGTESFSNVLQGARDWSIGKSLRGSVKTGLEWSIDDIHNPFVFLDATFGPFRSERSIDRQMWGVFTAASATINEHFNLEAGFRHDSIRWNLYDLLSPNLEKPKKSDAASPSVSASYRLTEELSVFGGYSESFKVPDSNTLIFETPNIFRPNADIDPSKARHWEIGARTVQKSFHAEAAVFLVETEKEILFNDITNRNENFDTKRAGVEAGGALELSKNLMWRPSASWTAAEFDGGAYSGMAVPMVPEFRWSSGLEWTPHEGYVLLFEVGGAANRYALNDFQNRFPAEDYWTTNLAFKKVLPNGLGDVYAKITNLLDHEYSSFVTSDGVGTVNVNPAPGFEWEAGVRIKI